MHIFCFVTSPVNLSLFKVFKHLLPTVDRKMNVIILLITTMYDEVYMYLADEHKIKVLTNTIICNSDFMILRHKGIIH